MSAKSIAPMTCSIVAGLVEFAERDLEERDSPTGERKLLSMAARAQVRAGRPETVGCRTRKINVTDYQISVLINACAPSGLCSNRLSRRSWTNAMRRRLFQIGLQMC